MIGLHLEHCNDTVVAIDDDDLIVDHEVQESTPLWTDLHDHPRDRDDPYAARHGSADADGEVDVAGARRVAADQDRLPDPGALLRRQRDVATSARSLLRLALRGALTLLTLVTLRSLTLRLVALGSGRALAALALSLARRLLAVALAALRLTLVLLTVSALRSLLALRRLARGLVLLAALHWAILLRLTLPFLSTLAGAVLSCGAALRALALCIRTLRAA
jgi:hypothetical protein